MYYLTILKARYKAFLACPRLREKSSNRKPAFGYVSTALGNVGLNFSIIRLMRRPVKPNKPNDESSSSLFFVVSSPLTESR